MITTIDQAAAVLDEKVPGWYKKIDTEKLNMENVDCCIIGQLFPGERYETAADRIFGKTTNIYSGPLGSFTNDWKALIKRRKARFVKVKKPVCISSGVFQVSRENTVVVNYKNKTLRLTEQEAKELAQSLLKICG